MSSRAIQIEEFNLTLMNKYTWFDGLTYNTHIFWDHIVYIIWIVFASCTFANILIARSQSKFRKVQSKKIHIASSLTALNTNFCSSKIHQKPLRAIAGGSVCGLGALTSQFCQWTPSFCCLHLSYCYCLLCFIVVNTNKLLQTQGQMTKINSCHSLFTYTRRFT